MAQMQEVHRQGEQEMMRWILKKFILGKLNKLLD